MAIGDGAEWIWNGVDDPFPNAVQMIDDPHAVGHLWNCAKKTKGFQNEEQVISWVKTTETFLFQGETQQVVKRISELAGAHPTHAYEVSKQAAYFQKQAHRMQYRIFREKGYQIGSGIVESACQHIVAERCKQAGMKWKKQGIDAILNWRCLLKNGSLSRYWQTRQAA